MLLINNIHERKRIEWSYVLSVTNDNMTTKILCRTLRLTLPQAQTEMVPLSILSRRKLKISLLLQMIIERRNLGMIFKRFLELFLCSYFTLHSYPSAPCWCSIADVFHFSSSFGFLTYLTGTFNALKITPYYDSWCPKFSFDSLLSLHRSMSSLLPAENSLTLFVAPSAWRDSVLFLIASCRHLDICSESVPHIFIGTEISCENGKNMC